MRAQWTVASAVALLVGVGCTSTESIPETRTSRSPVEAPSAAAAAETSAPASLATAGAEQEILDVVTSLSGVTEVGFTQEVLAAVDDPSLVLPDDATVEADGRTVDISGDLASVDAVVRAAGQPDQRYWVFLEKQDGAWLVYMTLPLTP